MKWVVDRIGKEQIWYSGDVIERIKEVCKTFGIISYHDRRGNLIAQTGSPVTAKILRIIESEVNDGKNY